MSTYGDLEIEREKERLPPIKCATMASQNLRADETRHLQAKPFMEKILFIYERQEPGEADVIGGDLVVSKQVARQFAQAILEIIEQR